MNLTQVLKKAVYRHLVTGIILSVALCILVLASKYKHNLIKATSDLDAIRMNVLRMENVTHIMREKRTTAIHLLPTDYNLRSHQEILLLSLEKVRSSIKEADIIVGNIVEENNEIALPVTLGFSGSQYHEGLNAIGYLRSLRFPYFKIRNVIAKRNEVGREIIWTIEGSFRIPSGRITGIPDRRASL